ncbi:MAG: hemerythrin domain-containing protein [Bacteroidales bacterium]|jgi:hemerythrin-like domain-containing protein
MKPTNDLKQEHKAIREMLKIMTIISGKIMQGSSADPAEIDTIVSFLRTFADKCHHGKEENVLFPAMVAKGIPAEQGPVAVMLYEHKIGRGLIEAISSYTLEFRKNNHESARLIADSMTKYAVLLEDHIKKEENVLFPLADKILSKSESDEVAEKFQKIEEDVVGNGVHEQYHELLNSLKRKYNL